MSQTCNRMFLATIAIHAIASVAGGHRGDGTVSMSISPSGSFEDDVSETGSQLTITTSHLFDNGNPFNNATHIQGLELLALLRPRRIDVSPDVLSTSLLNLSREYHWYDVASPRWQVQQDQSQYFLSGPTGSKWKLDTSRVLGKGSFGSVYEGFDDRNNNKVAVKFMKDNPDTDEPSELEFERQRQVISKYVLPVFAGFRLDRKFRWQTFVEKEGNVMEELSKGDFCIVMEKMNGDLQGQIKEDNRQIDKDNVHIVGKSDQVKKIWSMVLVAMMRVHEQGLIFRDLKPANIMCNVDKNGEINEVKLSDFGIATNKYPSNEQIGTPYYAAPEVINGRSYGAAVDAWALGVVLYTLFYGKVPFDARSVKAVCQKIVNEQLTFPKQATLRGDQNPDPLMTQLIQNLLQKQPEKRRCIRKSKNCEADLISKHPWVQETVAEMIDDDDMFIGDVRANGTAKAEAKAKARAKAKAKAKAQTKAKAEANAKAEFRAAVAALQQSNPTEAEIDKLAEGCFDGTGKSKAFLRVIEAMDSERKFSAMQLEKLDTTWANCPRFFKNHFKGKFGEGAAEAKWNELRLAVKRHITVKP